MHQDFLSLTDRLDMKFRQLMEMNPILAEEIPSDTPVGGIYLFSENDIPLYAGRTKRKLSVRIRSHFGPASDCPFAWLLSREITGHKATYTKTGSRKDLLSRPDFLSVYQESKKRIRTMHVRFVGEDDPLRQALLEIYTAVSARARYNDFDTH